MKEIHDLSKKYNLPLIPFLLEGVALKPDLNQSIYGLTNTDKSVFRIKDNENEIKVKS